MTKLSYTRALNLALAAEMERDPAVFVLGEDVRHALTNVTVGLFDRFGPERIVETPLSEQGVTNFATGAAMAGLRPVVEYQIPFLLMLVFEQIVNQANKFSLMSGGQARVPVTYLLPAAGWRPGWGGTALRPAVQSVRPLRREDRGARHSLGRVRAARTRRSGTTTRWWCSPRSARWRCARTWPRATWCRCRSAPGGFTGRATT